MRQTQDRLDYGYKNDHASCMHSELSSGSGCSRDSLFTRFYCLRDFMTHSSGLIDLFCLKPTWAFSWSKAYYGQRGIMELVSECGIKAARCATIHRTFEVEDAGRVPPDTSFL